MLTAIIERSEDIAIAGPSGLQRQRAFSDISSNSEDNDDDDDVVVLPQENGGWEDVNIPYPLQENTYYCWPENQLGLSDEYLALLEAANALPDQQHQNPTQADDVSGN